MATKNVDKADYVVLENAISILRKLHKRKLNATISVILWEGTVKYNIELKGEPTVKNVLEEVWVT